MTERPEWIDHRPDPRVVRRRRRLPNWLLRVLGSLGFLVGLAAWIVVCLSITGIALYVFLANAK
jgi:hypothetical protein